MKKKPMTLEEMRAAALAAIAEHEHDMKVDAAYKKLVDALQAKRDTAAIKAGRVR